MKRIIYPVIALVLAGCVTDTEILGNWQQTVKQANLKPDLIWLGGDGHKNHFHGIPTRAEAVALVSANKGKYGGMVGYLHKLNIKGNRAAIEIAPRITSENNRDCYFRYGGGTDYLDCLQSNKGIFTSTVTCHIANWKAVNQATGGTMQSNFNNRENDRNAWDHIMVEGVIHRVEDKISSYDTTPRYGYVGYGRNVTVFQHRTIHINKCRIAVYRGKVIPKI